MRVSLPQPIAGVAADEPIHVVDASLRGVRITHRRLFSPHAGVPVAFEFDGKEIELNGSVRWTKLQRGGGAVYQSGIEIVSIKTDAEVALRGLVQHQIELALDEQKANANGVPPLAVRSIQSEHATIYARHELINGVWRKTVTADRTQPLHGFTVATTEGKNDINVLRSAYEIADPQMRHIIQKIAEITISRSEGIPMRRYTP
ncbi:MAG TPA: PilZ domain-containing protein [Thermoanaerobaculia bacterium]|nr:PilZ domain-containing protein [Thermoanaerobaculia bacterium]